MLQRPMFQPIARPAGQAAAAPEIAIGPDGRLSGVDGLLDQVSQSVLRNARTELLPVLQQDKALQRTIGESIGRGAADEIKPYLVLLSASILTTGFLVWHSRRKHTNART